MYCEPRLAKRVHSEQAGGKGSKPYREASKTPFSLAPHDACPSCRGAPWLTPEIKPDNMKAVRMGRPRLPDLSRRRLGPHPRFSAAELAAVRQRAAASQLSVPAYVRRAALSCRLGEAVDTRILAQLDACGHRLNRAAKWGNERQYVPDLKRLSAILAAISDLVWRLAPRGVPAGGRVPPARVGGRTHGLQLWVTEAERVGIQQRARRHGLSQAAFTRSAALGASFVREGANDAVVTLARIQNNLSQLGRVARGAAQRQELAAVRACAGTVAAAMVRLMGEAGG